jgi:hypothetical protein
MSEHDKLNEMLSKITAPLTRRRLRPQLEECIEEEHKDILPQKYCQWATSDNSIFVGTNKTQAEITPGVYEIGADPQIGLFFKKIPVKTEGLIRFPDGNSDRVVSEIQKFWERDSLFEEYGLSFKRGILLYGPPGSGKSCTVQLAMADVIRKGGIAINFTDPSLFMAGFRIMRQIQPKCPIVTIMEDIESILEKYSESQILNILDGVNRVDYTVFLATTNYPQILGARIVNRPSRFDKRFRIGMPTAAARRVYFEHLIQSSTEKISFDDRVKKLGIDLDRWVKDTEEMSIAHLKELFIAVVILGDDYKEAVETLKTMTEPLNDRDYSRVGFNAGGAYRG